MGLTAKQFAVGLVLAGFSLTTLSVGLLVGPAWAGLAAGVGLMAVGALTIDVDRRG